jgi:hypothetical protein
MKMFKSNLEDRVNWLYLNFIKIWLTIGMLIIVSILFSTNQVLLFRFDWSEIGWGHFVDVFKVPLTFIGFGIPIYGIIVTMYRSIQNEKQLELFRQNVNFNNYYRHMDEFIKKTSSFLRKNKFWDGKDEEDLLRKIYVKWYGSDFKSKFIISNDILNLVKAYYDELNEIYYHEKELDLKKLKSMVQSLGFETKVPEICFQKLENRPEGIDGSLQIMIKICESIMEFSNQSIEKNEFVLKKVLTL